MPESNIEKIKATTTRNTNCAKCGRPIHKGQDLYLVMLIDKHLRHYKEDICLECGEKY